MTQVQVWRGFAENVRHTKTHRNPTDIIKTEDSAVVCNGLLGSAN